MAALTKRGKSVRRVIDCTPPPPNDAPVPSAPPPRPLSPLKSPEELANNNPAPMQRGKRVKMVRDRTPPLPNDAPVPPTPPPPLPSPSPEELVNNNLAPMQRGKRVKMVRDRTPPPPNDALVPLAPPPPPPRRPSSLSQSPEELANNDPETEFDFFAKKTRGKLSGKRLHDILKANNEKNMLVIFDLKQQVPIDAGVSAFFTFEIGILVRSDALVCYKRWMKVPAMAKEKLQESLLDVSKKNADNQKKQKYHHKGRAGPSSNMLGMLTRKENHFL
ncbi:uncharacterized protein LOC126602101 [Malus sylvestris]|uniref:uncharacterized protein LOC126602088 n=1 Tax=Malus sylvestris TaxID=3752 RepID=UPI0021ACDAB7|nr:uncharacterized protein LOC126602088 [Malus sylvestris]XP_050124882.1 uncharacterized protein LOC126602101 [Malus sylvestris]